MSDRPRVTIQHAAGNRSRPVGFGAPTKADAPYVALTVSFALHGHDEALAALTEAVEHVRTKIQEDQS